MDHPEEAAGNGEQERAAGAEARHGKVPFTDNIEASPCHKTKGAVK
jgi:hypothetical protein